MGSLGGALGLSALGVIVGTLAAQTAESLLVLSTALGGFDLHADPRPRVVAWTLSAYAIAGAISGLFLGAAVRTLATLPALRRRMLWVLGSALLWAGLGGLAAFLDSSWKTPLLVRAITPWLAPSAALAGAIPILVAARRTR